MFPAVVFDEVLQLFHTYGKIIGLNVIDRNFKISTMTVVLIASIITMILSLLYTIVTCELILALQSLPIVSVVGQVYIYIYFHK